MARIRRLEGYRYYLVRYHNGRRERQLIQDENYIEEFNWITGFTPGSQNSAMREVYHWAGMPRVAHGSTIPQFGTCARPASLVVSVVGLQSYHSNPATAASP